MVVLVYILATLVQVLVEVNIERKIFIKVFRSFDLRCFYNRLQVNPSKKKNNIPREVRLASNSPKCWIMRNIISPLTSKILHQHTINGRTLILRKDRWRSSLPSSCTFYSGPNIAQFWKQQLNLFENSI